MSDTPRPSKACATLTIVRDSDKPTGSSPWNRPFELRCHALILRITDEANQATQVQAGAWQELFKLIAPSLVRWATRSFLLRDAGMASGAGDSGQLNDDEVAVMAGTIETLVKNNYANLHSFLASKPYENFCAGGQIAENASADESADEGTDESADESAEPEAAEIPDEHIASAIVGAELVYADTHEVADEGDDRHNTPFRRWLLIALRFTTRNHLRSRYRSRSKKRSANAVGMLDSEVESIPDDRTGALTALLRRVEYHECRERLHGALARFSPDERHLLMAYGELKNERLTKKAIYESLARDTGRSEAEIEKTLRSLVGKLVRRLENKK